MQQVILDNIKFTKDKTTNYFLSSRNINGKRKRLHIYMYEKYHGQIKNGKVVHHIDGNKLNNNIENLTIVDKKEHSRYHGLRIDKTILAARLSKVRAKASDWHKSENGRAWHRLNCQTILKDCSGKFAKDNNG